MFSLKDVLELRRRFNRESCTITRMCGCYVDSEKEKVLKISETFLNMDNDEFYKYLDITKSLFSKKVEDQIMSLDFDSEFGQQDMLLRVRQSKLKDEKILDELYDRIIDNYDQPGHYLILIFHDAYDVLTATKDNNKLDESEEVYEYLMCAICPLHLSAPGLGYRADEHRIAPRIRDWVVDKTDCGFIWPSFEQRTEERDKVMFYSKKPAEPQESLAAFGLGCIPKFTATQERNKFYQCFEGFLDDDKKEDEWMLEVCERMYAMQVEDEKSEDTLQQDVLQDICIKSGIPEGISTRIKDTYKEKFQIGMPKISHLLSGTIIANIQEKNRKEHLREILHKAVITIETEVGAETDLTAELKTAIGQHK